MPPWSTRQFFSYYTGFTGALQQNLHLQFNDNHFVWFPYSDLRNTAADFPAVFIPTASNNTAVSKPWACLNYRTQGCSIQSALVWRSSSETNPELLVTVTFRVRWAYLDPIRDSPSYWVTWTLKVFKVERLSRGGTQTASDRTALCNTWEWGRFRFLVLDSEVTQIILCSFI